MGERGGGEARDRGAATTAKLSDLPTPEYKGAGRRCANNASPRVRDRSGAGIGGIGRRSTGRYGLFAAIVVEAALGLAAEPTRFDIFHQERTRAILGIGQAFVQDLHDRETGVEPDEICKLSGPMGWWAPSRMAVSMASTL